MKSASFSVAVFVGVVLWGVLYSGGAPAAAEGTLLHKHLALPLGVLSQAELQLVYNPHHKEKHHKKYYEPEEYNRPPRAERRRSRSVVCKSKEFQYNHCPVNRQGREVRLIRQLSDTRCVRGDNWGANRRGIWVDRGCSGKFVLE